MRALQFLKVLLLLTLTGAQTVRSTPSLEWVDPSDDDLLVLETSLNGLRVTEDLLAYLRRDRVFLPLAALMNTLELPIRVDPAAGLAEGWIAKKERRFSLRVVQQQMAAGGKLRRIRPAAVEVHRDDIFVDSDLLSEWLPISFQVDLASLTLQVSSEETLPIQGRLERAARWSQADPSRARALVGGHPRKRFALDPHPYELIAWPVLDATSTFEVSRDRDGRLTNQRRHSMLVQGDLLGMSAHLLLEGSETGTTPSGLSKARFSLSRHDSEARLLGPLYASAIRVGDVAPQLGALVSSESHGRGFEVARSAPGTSERGELDTTSLEGDAPSGSDVELYHNGLLLDFTTIDASGHYRFADVPLRVGANILRVVVYGPYGEQREETRRIEVGADLLRPGATAYRIGLAQQDLELFAPADVSDPDEHGSLRWGVELERGISHQLGLLFGLSSLELEGERRHYLRMMCRTSMFGITGQLRGTKDVGGGSVVSLGLQRRISRGLNLVVRHEELRDFRSEAVTNSDVVGRSEIRIEGGLRLPLLRASIARLPFSVRADRERSTRGESVSLIATSGQGFPVGRMLFGNRMEVRLSERALETRGRLLVRTRLPEVELTGSLSYGLTPRVVISELGLSGSLRLNERTRARMSISYGLERMSQSLGIGVELRRRRFTLGLDAGYSSSGGAKLGASVSLGLSRDPRSKQLSWHSDVAAARAALSARVFLDRDGDGRFGPGDAPISGAEFRQQGRRLGPATGDDGIVRLELPSNGRTDLEIVESSLPDPFWVPARAGIGLAVRPGAHWTAEFPVVETGEIDGTVTLGGDRSGEPVSAVAVQLLDSTGKVIEERKSQFDGFFLFTRIPPARYSLRISPEQLARLQLTSPSQPSVQLQSGEIRNGLQLRVMAQPETTP